MTQLKNLWSLLESSWAYGRDCEARLTTESSCLLGSMVTFSTFTTTVTTEGLAGGVMGRAGNTSGTDIASDCSVCSLWLIVKPFRKALMVGGLCTRVTVGSEAGSLVLCWTPCLNAHIQDRYGFWKSAGVSGDAVAGATSNFP